MKLFDVHEDILRHLWSGQYLDAHRLVTQDGRHLVVLEPGVLNRDSGPDFRDGCISLDGKIFRGDIEFHRTVADWKLHSHHLDERYNSVILHVVCRSIPSDAVTVSASGRSIPILSIEQFLSSPLEKIVEHAMRDEHTSRTAPLPCAERKTRIDFKFQQEWVNHLALDRMKAKAVTLFARLAEIAEERKRDQAIEGKENAAVDFPDKSNEDYPERGSEKAGLDVMEGWQQVLYEGIMDGLGYSKNRIPFVTLAQRASVSYIRRLSVQQELSIMELEAVLFHVSGLRFDLQLMKDQDAKIHLHQLHAAWRSVCGRADRAVVQPDGCLRAADWVFSPTRPSNFPTARIAVASELLGRIVYRGFLTSVVHIVADEKESAKETLNRLLTLLNLDVDPFWSFHYSFAESSPREHLLLGETRRYEIIINTILPLCSLYALILEQERIHERAVRIAMEIPPIEDNFIIRKMKKHLLNGIPIHSAYQQQGLIQLYERYCSGSKCDECKMVINFSRA